MSSLHTIIFVGIIALTPLAPAEDAIELRDLSRLRGEIVGMKEGVLTLKMAGGGEEHIKWYHLVGVTTVGEHVLVLKDGQRLTGTVRPGPMPGALLLHQANGEELSLPLRSVEELDPPADVMHWKGHLGIAAAASDGNTNPRTLGLLGEVIARTEKHRLTLDGQYNHAEDDDGLRARNGRGRGKYDYFVFPRIYTLGHTLFERDRFQDLELRTVFGGGLGYQIAERGDYPDEYLNGFRWLNDLEVSAEAGLSYFVEDYRISPNESNLSARWSARLDWQPLPKVTVFHRHEGFPSVENRKDVYVLTQQGVRVSLYGGLYLALQANWNWDNTPARGFDRSEVLYLINLGFVFESSKEGASK